jgi:hypothetical protein
MPTPVEWADERDRMENIRIHRGCPHGRLGPCYACDQLNLEAQEVFENEGGSPGEGGEFD